LEANDTRSQGPQGARPLLFGIGLEIYAKMELRLLNITGIAVVVVVGLY